MSAYMTEGGKSKAGAQTCWRIEIKHLKKQALDQGLECRCQKSNLILEVLAKNLANCVPDLVFCGMQNLKAMKLDLVWLRKFPNQL